MFTNFALWPKDVLGYFRELKEIEKLPAKMRKKMRDIALIQIAGPLAGALLLQELGRRGFFTVDRLLLAYVGGGLGNVLSLPFATWVGAEYMKYEAYESGLRTETKGVSAKTAADVGPQQQDISGPLSGGNLAPIIGYNKNPPLPRYPMGTGSYHALNTDLGWKGALMHGNRRRDSVRHYGATFLQK